MWEIEENLDVSDFDIRAMLEDTMLDMEILAEFIEDIMAILFQTKVRNKMEKLALILSFFDSWLFLILYLIKRLTLSSFRGKERC